MKGQPRYAIGIDLGTSNCSLAYKDLQAPESLWELLEIPQWESEGQLSNEVRLPSFAWLLPKSLVKQGSRRLPWHAPDETVRAVLGREAKFKALTHTDQVAFAAKSWMSVGPQSTRQARILPWGSQSLIGEQKLSPSEVQALLLQHLAAAWNARFASGPEPAPFFQQKIVITVPASFDDLAQRLTLEAAAAANYPSDVELLEEPQAAFYAWYARHQSQLPKKDCTLLVCDIGGGTSDFTLLRLRANDSQKPLERLRVSEHLLLGGDNIDLSLADSLQSRMGVEQLSRSAWQALLAQARQLKEALLQSEGPEEEEFHVSIPLESGQLFGAYASATTTRAELLSWIEEGFFPVLAADARPEHSSAAMRPHGLAYAEDSAITRHLAGFLQGQSIDLLLCAGGTLLPKRWQQRLKDIIQSWQSTTELELLSLEDSDLAIAQGAAWYAAARVTGQTLVESPFPRSLYLELADSEGQPLYLCVLAKGQRRQVPQELSALPLSLRLGQTVRFQLYSSLEDAIPQTRVRAPQWKALPLLSSELKSVGTKQEQLPISLETMIRDTGLFELRCVSKEANPRTWTLDFTVEESGLSQDKSSSPASSLPALTPLQQTKIQSLIQETFGKQGCSGSLAEALPKKLEEVLGQEREQWTLPTLRALADLLLPLLHKRDRTLEHEASWYLLTGYCLRPGWGAPGDADRLKKLWPLFEHGISKSFSQERRVQDQYAILWRRVAGGLKSVQQEKILDRILPSLRKSQDPSAELIRLAASLERVPLEKKISLGRLLVQQFTQGNKDHLDARAWALGRVASRYPLAAGVESIIPPHIVEEWADALATLPWPSRPYQRLKLFYHWAGRMRGDRLIDLEARYRQIFLEKLRTGGATEDVLASLVSVQIQSNTERQQEFGESLPVGIIFETRI